MLRKILTTLLTIFGGLSFLTQPASAVTSGEISLALSPSSQTITLTPGQTATGKITVYNTGAVGFDFGLRTTPYQVDSETYDPDFSTNNVYTQMYTWIKFPEETYRIEPGQQIEVQFTIDVPESAVGGGQYATVMAYATNLDNDGSAVQTIPQIASLIYGRVNGPEMYPEGEIAEQEIPGFLFQGPLEIKESIYNTGNVDFKVYHAVQITDYFSDEVLFDAEARDENGELIGAHTSVVLPGTSRQDTLVWENTPRIGIVKVKQAVMFLEESLEYERVVIFCPLWLILSVLGLIALGTLWIILAAKHRKRKAPQVF